MIRIRAQVEFLLDPVQSSNIVGNTEGYVYYIYLLMKYRSEYRLRCIGLDIWAHEFRFQPGQNEVNLNSH